MHKLRRYLSFTKYKQYRVRLKVTQREFYLLTPEIVAANCVHLFSKTLSIAVLVIGPGNESPMATNVVLVLVVVLLIIIGVVVIRDQFFGRTLQCLVTIGSLHFSVVCIM